MRNTTASQRAIESIGVNALAVKAIDSIVQEANLVGVSGEGARGVIEVNLRKEFSLLDCPSGGEALVTFSFYNYTRSFAKADFGIQDYIPAQVNHTYRNSADYDIVCNFTGITLGNDTEVCMCFEEDNGDVKVTGVNKTSGGCVCPSNVCECSSCAECTAKLADPGCGAVMLNQSISNSSVCIDIPTHFSADKVFNCNGHSITRVGGGAGIDGIRLNNDNHDLTFSNCVLANWNNCIYIGSLSTNIKLVGMQMSGCATGINLQPNANDNVISRARITGCGTGIDIQPNAKNNQIRSNKVCLSTGPGDIQDQGTDNYGANTCNIISTTSPTFTCSSC